MALKIVGSNPISHPRKKILSIWSAGFSFCTIHFSLFNIHYSFNRIFVSSEMYSIISSTAQSNISLENSGAKIQSNSKVWVTMPIPADYDRERLTVYYVAEDGTKAKLPRSMSGDMVTFETDHFSLYVMVEKAVDAASAPEKTGNGLWLWIALGVALVAVAGGGFALWWFKLRKTA